MNPLRHLMPSAPITSGLVVLGLAACGGYETDRLRISTWVSSPAETVRFEQTLDGFRQAHPETAFAYEPIPGNYSEKIQLMLGTRTAPDLFFLKDMVAPSYMGFDVLMPLDELIARDAAFNPEDFYPALWNAFNRHGVQYGIPKDFSPYVLYYNKALFARAGLERPPTDWRELEDYARKLTVVSGDGEVQHFGLVLEPVMEMIMPFVLQNGGTFQKADGSLGITDPEFIEALTFYHGLYQAGIATIPTDVGQGWNGDTFGRGKAAMAISGGWLMPYLEDNHPDIDFAVAELPVGKERATVVFTTAFAMPRATRRPDEAWRMLRYLTGKEGMALWTGGGIALPSRRSVAEENGFYDDPIYGVFMRSAEYAHPFQVQFSERGFEEVVVGVQAIFFADAEPLEAMRGIERRIKNYRVIN